MPAPPVAMVRLQAQRVALQRELRVGRRTVDGDVLTCSEVEGESGFRTRVRSQDRRDRVRVGKRGLGRALSDQEGKGIDELTLERRQW